MPIFAIVRKLMGLFILLFSQTSLAATATANLSVTATVINACAFGTITSVAFGNYDPTSATANNNTGSIVVQCTLGDVYNIALNPGTFAGATVTTRRMTGPSAGGLAYSLFRDSARTLNWGQTIGTNTLQVTGNGLAQTATVYGQISASQAVTAGSYSDTVGITVTF
jgi:spore coat protein U domain-containing protein, fimbrial subunit CupE1/2/3/6